MRDNVRAYREALKGAAPDLEWNHDAEVSAYSTNLPPSVWARSIAIERLRLAESAPDILDEFTREHGAALADPSNPDHERLQKEWARLIDGSVAADAFLGPEPEPEPGTASRRLAAFVEQNANEINGKDRRDLAPEIRLQLDKLTEAAAAEGHGEQLERTEAEQALDEFVQTNGPILADELHPQHKSLSEEWCRLVDATATEEGSE